MHYFLRTIATAIIAMAGLGGLPKSVLAETTTFFIVRHAEKQSGTDDVELSDDGKKRAKSLGQLLAPFKVSKVYVTDTKRAKQTAEPTSASLATDHVKTYKYETTDFDALAQQNAGKAVLIVGHSDSVNLIVNKLAGSNFASIGETFDNLFIVTVDDDKKAVVRLRYSAAP